ncbi:protein phosphatase 2C domain-containing protein [Paenibacillus sp. JX-17]|uniref:Protein phosphatase 2C domain-containing protein n=1 Tax=Paenibacillus lacisoli TaxID=3064525 RepID=A0ABT9CDY1_9BACL|nr:protein phosphatase 2C domain-containing protein [Paenibacillus sp. JX-17]MDO7907484.1 protein phosphatase 2C domain-containing protein [Paenibacillus sp. JX-17]
MNYIWIGSEKPYLNEPNVIRLNKELVAGHYGGNVAQGAHKNEDALYVLRDEQDEWTFAAILDAHRTADSAELVIDMLKKHGKELERVCRHKESFQMLEAFILGKLTNAEFLAVCTQLQGETSCLFLYQKHNYIWWMSIGDCMAYLLHPELARLGQYMLNQRQFYEWVGLENSFSQEIPSYTTGRRQLRQGSSYIVLATDGLLDTKDQRYEEPEPFMQVWLKSPNLEAGLDELVHSLHAGGCRDSATLLCWRVDHNRPAAMPSDMQQG